MAEPGGRETLQCDVIVIGRNGTTGRRPKTDTALTVQREREEKRREERALALPGLAPARAALPGPPVPSSCIDTWRSLNF